jgi:hypothetical protein
MCDYDMGDTESASRASGVASGTAMTNLTRQLETTSVVSSMLDACSVARWASYLFDPEW